MLDTFPWMFTIVVGPVILGIALAWALMRRRRSNRRPSVAPDHPSRDGGEPERIKTP